MFEKTINQSVIVQKRLKKIGKKINLAIDMIFETINSGNKVFICGNGGSAAHAQHLAAEFLVRLRPKVNRKPYPVISLALDSSTLTACGNDYSFSEIFSRNLEALATSDDLLITLTTSGKSKNIKNVINYSKKLKMKSISFLGNKGGNIKGQSTLDLIVDSNNTARIQEAHILIGHYIFENVEDLLISHEK